MTKLIDRIEKLVVLGLLALMIIVVAAGAIELTFVIFQEMLNPPRYFLLDGDELLRIFGLFLMVLIGLELLATVRMYITDETIHVELVMVVALIAVSRKIIVLDYEKLQPLTVLGIAALVISLSAGYYMMKKSKRS